MSCPSVMKITKNGVEYTSSVDRVNYTIEELTRAALKDVGRYMLRIVSQNLRAESNFLKKSKYAKKRYQMWVRKQENDLQLGIENTKYGAESAWWADQFELGTCNMPKKGFLYAAVSENIDQIREIEGQYLSAIEDENKALGLIDEEEAQEAAEDDNG